jgi:hypothetical protein
MRHNTVEKRREERKRKKGKLTEQSVIGKAEQ